MIQDIYPKKFYNEFKKESLKDGDIVLTYDGHSVFTDENFNFPTGSIINKDDAVYIFSIDNTRYFLNISDSKPENFKKTDIRKLRLLPDIEKSFAGETGYHIYYWYQTSRYCGRCGHKTVFSQNERALICPECGNIIYPRINPAVIVCVLNGDKILVSTYAGRQYKNIALIAGFCEFGETAEETVRREVMEETGLKVKNIRYYADQPWGFDQDLLFGFICDLDGSDKITIQKSELKTAYFATREEVKNKVDTLSLTGTMINDFAEGKI